MTRKVPGSTIQIDIGKLFKIFSEQCSFFEFLSSCRYTFCNRSKMLEVFPRVLTSRNGVFSAITSQLRHSRMPLLSFSLGVDGQFVFCRQAASFCFPQLRVTIRVEIV